MAFHARVVVGMPAEPLLLVGRMVLQPSVPARGHLGEFRILNILRAAQLLGESGTVTVQLAKATFLPLWALSIMQSVRSTSSNNWRGSEPLPLQR